MHIHNTKLGCTSTHHWVSSSQPVTSGDDGIRLKDIDIPEMRSRAGCGVSRVSGAVRTRHSMLGRQGALRIASAARLRSARQPQTLARDLFSSGLRGAIAQPSRFLQLAPPSLAGMSASLHHAAQRPRGIALVGGAGGLAIRRALLSGKPNSALPPARWSGQWVYHTARDMILHYYHGSRLLIADTKIASRMFGRLITGRQLSRREHKLLVRVLADLSRVVPLAFFVLVRRPVLTCAAPAPLAL